MKALVVRPPFAGLLNRRPWLEPSSLRLRTFSSPSSSSSNYSNQSRGGLPRFFSEVLPHSKGGVVRIQDDEFWHMTKVLRLNTRDRVELFNGKGGLIEGCIQDIDRNGLEFVALEDLKIVLPQSTQWHVFAAFGTLKGGRADWLVEKCTELGASSVTPLLTARSPSISENRMDRLRRVILAAAKQYFTEKEVDMIIKAVATGVGLGPHRLRVETATIALLATVMLCPNIHSLLGFASVSFKLAHQYVATTAAETGLNIQQKSVPG